MTMPLEPLFVFDLPSPVAIRHHRDERGESPKGTTGGRRVVDLTPYFLMSQAKAAAALGIPVSTLSKRWGEAANKRKWPYRKVLFIDLLIEKLGKCSENEAEIARLRNKRRRYLTPVKIATGGAKKRTK